MNIPTISFFDEETQQSSLTGLSTKEKLYLQEIVQKQFDKGIKIKIRYTQISIPNE